SIFSSLAREYGFSAFDNDIMIANIISWLTGAIESEGKPVTVEVNLDLFYWAENVVKEEKWEGVSDLINVSLKYFKDNYSKIIEEIKEIRKEKLKKRKAYEKAKIETEEEDTEDKILEKVPIIERKKEDLEEIMTALEEITGEHYEISIDLEEGEELIELPGLVNYTNDDIVEFEKTFFNKKAIWHGRATIAFKEWLNEKYEK
ncbi:MAG: hypothetical protein ACFFG0_13590, partial [Candidatus Thorarchaeota archaeon]